MPEPLHPSEKAQPEQTPGVDQDKGQGSFKRDVSGAVDQGGVPVGAPESSPHSANDRDTQDAAQDRVDNNFMDLDRMDERWNVKSNMDKYAFRRKTHPFESDPKSGGAQAPMKIEHSSVDRKSMEKQFRMKQSGGK